MMLKDYPTAKPHTTAEVKITYEAAECAYGVYLNAQLTKDGKVWAMTQHELPCLMMENKATKCAGISYESEGSKNKKLNQLEQLLIFISTEYVYS